VWVLSNSFSVESIEIANDWKPIFEEIVMTKKELYEAMGGRISMSSIREYSDEYQITFVVNEPRHYSQPIGIHTAAV